ncbi:MAG: FHA domain-containing protein [Myxococcaceae bacterium]|nr:FHA domain-containing protein [Myxococcaceae bacterium]
MKTLLLSALTRQFLIQGARFSELHPNDWLLWEAGTLAVPRGNIATANTVSDPLDAGAARPRVGDPLCFVLPTGTAGSTVTIGRAEGNTIVLSDETVSRHHLTLVWNEGWSAVSAEDHSVFTLDGKPVQPGRFVTVSSGQALGLGHLELSLYTAQGMFLRLAAKLARR